MKVLLINPPSERIIEKWDRPDFPHLDLAYLASFLREKGVNVWVIDAKFENLNINQVVDKAKQVSHGLFIFWSSLRNSQNNLGYH